jgi:hypothetical protein
LDEDDPFAEAAAKAILGERNASVEGDITSCGSDEWAEVAREATDGDGGLNPNWAEGDGCSGGGIYKPVKLLSF